MCVFKNHVIDMAEAEQRYVTQFKILLSFPALSLCDSMSCVD